MKILAIDTSSTLASVSTMNEENVLTVQDTNNITHSERLLKLIHKALGASDLKLNDLDYFMTTNGPGSFTGSRIGAVTIKGLSFPLNKKIIAVSSLEAMMIHSYISLNISKEIIICNIMDAKNDRAYYSISKVYKENDKIKYALLCDISNDTLNDIFNKLENTSSPIYIASDINDNISVRFSNSKYTFLPSKIVPNSSFLIEYFQNVDSEILKEHIKDTYTLDITYARMSQAERIKNGEKN